ncbi:MAG: TIGR02147 family protein [Bdellovibrionaceae bacterium]|nr:TIGR02147 family protein [Pseudobdellovibrionaceae bacterium]
MDVFSYDDYRLLIKDKLSLLPKSGHGQAKRLAEYVGVSTAFISQVLSHTRHLAPEQNFLVTEFLGLSEMETRYFLKLMEWEKSGNHKHKKWLRKALDSIREESKKISSRIQFQKVLSDEEKAIFYSDWYYSAIRMHCSIAPRSLNDLVAFLGLPRSVVTKSLQFLANCGLITLKDELYEIGSMSTHVHADSPWVMLHHSNWRKKALENVKLPATEKVHYTSPMTLSQSDAEKIQAMIHKMIEEIGTIVDPSPAEQIMCLNIDWFRVGKYSE